MFLKKNNLQKCLLVHMVIIYSYLSMVMNQQTVNTANSAVVNNYTFNSNGTISLNLNTLLMNLIDPNFKSQACNAASDCQKTYGNCSYASAYYQGRTVYSVKGACINQTI